MGKVILSEAATKAEASMRAKAALESTGFCSHCTDETQIELLIVALHHYANSLGMSAQDWADILEDAQDTYHADGGNDDHFWLE